GPGPLLSLLALGQLLGRRRLGRGGGLERLADRVGLDLLGGLGVRRQDRNDVAADLGEAAVDEQTRDVVAALDAHFADAEPADQRGAARQNAELAVEHGQRDKVRRLIHHRALRRHDDHLDALSVYRRLFNHWSPETRRRGDRETRRNETYVSLSPCLLVLLFA